MGNVNSGSRSKYGNGAHRYRKSLKKFENVERAWELRILGLSITKIAQQMGASKGAVHGWLFQHLEEVKERAGDMAMVGRLEGIAKMDRVTVQQNQVINALMPLAMKGDVDAAMALSRAQLVLIRADQRRSAYTGSDVPKEVKQKLTVESSVAPIIVTLADIQELQKLARENKEGLVVEAEGEMVPEEVPQLNPHPNGKTMNGSGDVEN